MKKSTETRSFTWLDRLGLNEDQGFPPPSPEAMQPYPEEPVGEADSGALDLLPQREVLQGEVGARSEGGPGGGEERFKQTNQGGCWRKINSKRQIESWQRTGCQVGPKQLQS